HVIHAAGMGQDLKTSGEIVASCTAASLRCAEALGIASIAFPAIGTGVGGLPVDEAARQMLRASADHLRAGGGGLGGGLERIEFVLFSAGDFEAFASALEDA
ncbi:MAG: macro domain-containing protein, partial [bacterium]